MVIFFREVSPKRPGWLEHTDLKSLTSPLFVTKTDFPSGSLISRNICGSHIMIYSSNDSMCPYPRLKWVWLAFLSLDVIIIYTRLRLLPTHALTDAHFVQLGKLASGEKLLNSLPQGIQCPALMSCMFVQKWAVHVFRVWRWYAFFLSLNASLCLVCYAQYFLSLSLVVTQFNPLFLVLYPKSKQTLCMKTRHSISVVPRKNPTSNTEV